MFIIDKMLYNVFYMTFLCVFLHTHASIRFTLCPVVIKAIEFKYQLLVRVKSESILQRNVYFSFDNQKDMHISFF